MKKILIAIFVYFNLKRPFKKYHIEIVKTDEMLKKLYQFRYKIYCEDVNLLDKRKYPQQYETDEFDSHSVHFVVLNRQGEIVGTLRLIKNSKLQFPTIEEFKLNDTLEHILPEKIVEISRFMVRRDYRKTMLMVDMCKTVYLYCKKNHMDYMLGCAEKWFVHSMNQLFGPLNIIKEPKFCFNALNYPFLLGTQEAQRNAAEISKILLKYFNQETENIILS